MKVLSLTEPYATCILTGVKKIETRSWKTAYRGPLLIHASATRIPPEYRKNAALMALVDPGSLHFGHIICSCVLADCIPMTAGFIEEIRRTRPAEYAAGVYAEGRYAWLLTDVRPLPEPILAKGRLGLWKYHSASWGF